VIDEYKLLAHPSIAGHGPTLYQSGCPADDSSNSSRPSRSATAPWPALPASVLNHSSVFAPGDELARRRKRKSGRRRSRQRRRSPFSTFTAVQ
jgi:hypothetical protein